EQLVQELSGGSPAARGRVRLAFEEGGFSCRVGGAKVIAVHGNEVDAWNVTDWEQLRRIGEEATRAGAAPAWTPNGGTKLVIEVMNGIKARSPFVALLKPEGGAVAPTLLVLDPFLAAKVGAAVPAWARSRLDRVRLAV